MPKYLIKVSYSQQGVQGLLKEGGTARKQVVEKLTKGLGGNLESFYYAFGENDVYFICEVPDEATMTAIALTVAASGSANISTTVLIDPETIDEATKKTINYLPPGQ